MAQDEVTWGETPMDLEQGFLAAIAARPDDEVSYLVYADWLEETGQLERAELIRLSCQFDPHRDRFDDENINALRERVRELRRGDEEKEQEWREALHKGMGWGMSLDWRRGLVAGLEVPVQWFLDYGEQFRQRYPVLHKLVLFRLDGWGLRLAACRWLRGIREIELACWYSDADALAVASSPYLKDVERVVLWADGGLEQGRAFARGAWPKLRELHLVSQGGAQEEWASAVNEAAGRPIATVYDFGRELYPFAANFAHCYGFFIGKLPDGTQLFAYGDESNPTADGSLFHPDGARRELFRVEFPPELVLPREAEPGGDVETRLRREDEVRAARRAYLEKRIGFVPAFIRVEGFNLEACGLSGTGRFRGAIEECWGEPDDPNLSPEDDVYPYGCGGQAYEAVRSGEYTFDFGNEWWCDRTGHITST